MLHEQLPLMSNVLPSIRNTEPFRQGVELCKKVGVMIAYFSPGLTIADPPAIGCGNG